MIWFMLLIPIALVAIWFTLRNRKISERKAQQRERAQRSAMARQSGNEGLTQANTKTQHHAIEVQSKESACEAVLALEGVKFLSMDAPVLPLPDCNNPNCHCSYKHYDDRRQEESRRLDIEINNSFVNTAAGEERRKEKKGRRQSDN